LENPKEHLKNRHNVEEDTKQLLESADNIRGSVKSPKRGIKEPNCFFDSIQQRQKNKNGECKKVLQLHD
jgi:hypothetical protein